MPKKFVVKSQMWANPNKTRPLSKDEIVTEFLAYKIYGLFCRVPEVFILKKGKQYSLASEFLPGFLTLAQYVGHGTRAPLSDDQLDFDETMTYQDKFAQIEGLLGVLAGAILLKDWDCVGAGFSNLGIHFTKDGKVEAIKIDPGKAQLFLSECGGVSAETEEEFKDLLSSPSSSGDACDFDEHLLLIPFSVTTSPNFKWVFRHFTAEDKVTIAEKISQVTDDIIHEIIDDPQLDLLLTPEKRKMIFHTLKNRVSAIRSQFAERMTESPMSSSSSLSSVTSAPAIRAYRDFKPTGEMIHDGNSMPSIFTEVSKDKKHRVRSRFSAIISKGFKRQKSAPVTIPAPR